MKKNLVKIVAIAGLLALLFGVLAAVMPAQASNPGQETTPVAPEVTVVVTQVIPQTGDNDNGTGGMLTSTWLLLVIIAVALVAIIIGLIARGSSRTL